MEEMMDLGGQRSEVRKCRREIVETDQTMKDGFEN